jgi:hypothetical protein
MAFPHPPAYSYDKYKLVRCIGQDGKEEIFRIKNG